MSAVLVFLNSTVGRVLVGLTLLATAIFFYSGWVYSKGETEWKTKYTALKTQYETSQTLQNEAWGKALAITANGQKEVLNDLRDKVKALEARQVPVKVVVKEVTKYVTAKADRSCTVTAGFQWVYNSTLYLPTDAQLAGSRPRDVDAPSGLALSRVASVAGENNTECTKRGELLELWQSWYLKNKAIFERLQLMAPQP